MRGPFVPPDFDPPSGMISGRFVLEPLGPEHNRRDHAAWMSSIDHIHATRGYDDDPENDDPWPVTMTLEQNLSDLEEHAQDFADRRGFTYTVLDPRTRDVIGCVYIYPPIDDGHDAIVRSWVRASHAELDGPLRAAVRGWLVGDAWPFTSPRYAGSADA